MNLAAASFLSWLLLPVAGVLAFGVRRRSLRLPPPRGAQQGCVGDEKPAWRLLVMGDSSAAGVGAHRVEESLGPRLAAIIHGRTGESVSWRNAGANSAIAAQIRDYVLPHIEDRGFTHIVLAVGTNDMKNYRTARQFKQGFGSLLYAIHARWPEATVIWSPVIDTLKVPALPPLLGAILNLRVRIINAMGERMCRERQAIAATPLPVESDEGFAVDGFHANAAGYDFWAGHLARFILAERERRSSSLQ